MKNGTPAAYQRFRTAWSVLHMALLVCLLCGVVLWAMTDGQGARALADWWEGATKVWETVFHLVPFPWGT